jgi:hypothetical protein
VRGERDDPLFAAVDIAHRLEVKEAYFFLNIAFIDLGILEKIYQVFGEIPEHLAGDDAYFSFVGVGRYLPHVFPDIDDILFLEKSPRSIEINLTTMPI